MTKKKKENEKLYEEQEIEEIGTIDPESEISIAIEVNQAKHKTFLRLAKPRTQKVLDSIRILGNCSNKSTYDYTPLEIDLMFGTIRRILDETEDKFYKITEKGKTLFEF